MMNRRTLLTLLPAAGVTLRAGATDSVDSRCDRKTIEEHTAETRHMLHGWQFSYGGESASTAVRVPHTWQALGGRPGYVGTGTYQLSFPTEPAWHGRWVRLECEAATHTTHVSMNGKPVGEHIGKGYTAFTCDLTPALVPSGTNQLVITVNNTPSDTMLPRKDSYDWVNDGGLIRPVNLLITPEVFIERVEIDAVPDSGYKSAQVGAHVVVRNAGDTARAVELGAEFWPEGDAQELMQLAPMQLRCAAGATTTVALPAVALEDARLWHFDHPEMYAARFLLTSEAGTHEYAETFGIRSFEVRGTEFLLNGEAVSFMGVERMAGSNPDFGMAETEEWIKSNHDDMKQLNCVYTRVHWPQDRRVLDYCDRHGILMQEEIPAWGAATFADTTDAIQQALEQNGLEQLREMIARDRNHPCIVTWGLCNEVNGKNPRTRQFAHTVSREATRLDPHRLQTYASNTLFEDPGADMAGDFSFVSTNEYYGSWEPGGIPEVRRHIAGIRAAFPDKPIVVSEYGWCECQPTILPGDYNRVDVVNEHTEVFRESGQVAGAIYFDYNDYRTLVGDKGEGAFRQRVHGTVDLYARRKPSFEALRLQSSPFTSLAIKHSADSGLTLEMKLRHRVPAYTLHGYQVHWVFYGYDDLPMAGYLDMLPALAAGAQHTVTAPKLLEGARHVIVNLLRPTGFSVATVEFPLCGAAG